MERTLLLNASYEPLRVISWQRAVLLFFQDKAEIVDSYGRRIRSVSTAMPVPAVVRLRKMVRPHKFQTQVKFSRKTVFTRDGHTCQYCGEKVAPKDLTLDHVKPVCQGGLTTWDNLVSACKPCNYKKAGRTPEQAGLKLKNNGKKPYWSPAVMVMLSLSENPPEVWKNYLYS
jgi:5-methylcytosine-specific restriction endonuclease McrA